MNKPPPGIARFDSAAAMAQALASMLHGRRFSSPSQSPLLDRLMPAINAMPERQREWAYILGGMSEGIDLHRARNLDIERIAQWLADLYPQVPYRCAFVGSSNGAMIHLAAALRAPWLPQTFLCPVRAPFSDPDDAQRGFSASRRVVDALLAADGRIAVHHMHDPNQDRLMLHGMRYFRLKHRRLPLAFREFLLTSLEHGATLYVVNCTRDWAVTRTSDRSVFQFGATGGASEDEYFEGGERVRAFLAHYGSPRTRWDPPAPDTRAPEAEWGFDTALMDDLDALAGPMQWRIVEIRFEEPEALSFVTAMVYRRWYEESAIERRRLVVDSFMLMDPLSTLELHAVPFWLLFGVEPSADALQRFLDAEAPFEEIDMTLFSHGTQSVGLAPIARWRGLLARARHAGRFAGVDTSRFPRDFGTFERYGRALAQLQPRLGLPSPLYPSHFESLLSEFGAPFGVHCEVRSCSLSAAPEY